MTGSGWASRNESEAKEFSSVIVYIQIIFVGDHFCSLSRKTTRPGETEEIG